MGSNKSKVSKTTVTNPSTRQVSLAESSSHLVIAKPNSTSSNKYSPIYKKGMRTTSDTGISTTFSNDQIVQNMQVYAESSAQVDVIKSPSKLVSSASRDQLTTERDDTAVPRSWVPPTASKSNNSIPRNKIASNRERDPYNPRLRIFAPPVYIDNSRSRSYSGSNRNCNNGPVDRLKNVDVVEELCYHVPGEPTPSQAYDYYKMNECGELEFVAEGPTSPGETTTNPVTYTKRQRFNFKQPQRYGDDEGDDGPPFAWPYDLNPCKCNCCVGGRGRDPKCQCQCCNKGRARRAYFYDEIPVGKNPDLRRDSADTDDIYSATDLIKKGKCDGVVPSRSGIYYFDAEKKKFIPHEPEIMQEMLPPPPQLPPPPPPEIIEEIPEPVIQPIIIPAPGCYGGGGMNNCGCCCGGNRGMNCGMGMGNNMMGCGGGNMGMNCGMGMGSNMMGCGGNNNGNNCCPMACPMPVMMMPGCGQQAPQQPQMPYPPYPFPYPEPSQKKKKQKKKKSIESEEDEEVSNFPQVYGAKDDNDDETMIIDTMTETTTVIGVDESSPTVAYEDPGYEDRENRGYEDPVYEDPTVQNLKIQVDNNYQGSNLEGESDTLEGKTDVGDNENNDFRVSRINTANTPYSTLAASSAGASYTVASMETSQVQTDINPSTTTTAGPFTEVPTKSDLANGPKTTFEEPDKNNSSAAQRRNSKITTPKKSILKPPSPTNQGDAKPASAPVQITVKPPSPVQGAIKPPSPPVQGNPKPPSPSAKSNLKLPSPPATRSLQRPSLVKGNAETPTQKPSAPSTNK